MPFIINLYIDPHLAVTHRRSVIGIRPVEITDDFLQDLPEAALLQLAALAKTNEPLGMDVNDTAATEASLAEVRRLLEHRAW